jgi:hypothetical protein
MGGRKASLLVLTALLLGCNPNRHRDVEAMPTVRCEGDTTLTEFANALVVISERAETDGIVYQARPPRIMEGQFHEYAYQYSDDYFLHFGSVAEPGKFAISIFRYEGASTPSDEALLTRARELLADLDICEPMLQTN